MDEQRTPRLYQLLEDVDRRLGGVSLDDELYGQLDLEQLHLSHGVAGRLQDRVITILTRLTMEMAAREDEAQSEPVSDKGSSK